MHVGALRCLVPPVCALRYTAACRAAVRVEVLFKKYQITNNVLCLGVAVGQNTFLARAGVRQKLASFLVKCFGEASAMGVFA